MLFHELRSHWRKRFQRWLDRRIPPARQRQLGHRSIFILPTRVGWMFLLLLLLLLVTAINYQSSLIYGLTFWLFSAGMTAMYLTFRNLKGLTLISREANDGYAGQVFDVPVQLEAAPGRYHLGLWLNYPDQPAVACHLPEGGSETLTLAFRSEQRGVLQPGRLLVESRFPLGLFRAWSWVRLEFSTLVYPAPVEDSLNPVGSEQGGELEGATLDAAGQQDFRGLRQYQPGDSMRQIAWKQLARGKGLVTKDFDTDQGATCWLDWQGIRGHDEHRLSVLTHHALALHQAGWSFGLQLPGVTVAPDQGERHLRHCLRVLAVWGLELPDEVHR